MVGNIILLEAALLILPALVALCYQEMNGVFSFSLTIIIAALTGGAMKLIFKPSNRVIYAREGFKVCSEEFMEDDIPHVYMKLNIE